MMFILLAILIFLYNSSFAFVQLSGEEPSAIGEYLYSALFICGVGWWLQAESEKHKLQPLYCRGLLIQTGWPVIVPYYLLKTRGVKGLIPLGILIASFILAQFLGIIVYVLLTLPPE